MIRLLLFLALAALPARAAEPLRLTIFHTNDIHGWIMPRPSSVDYSTSPLVGGAAVLAKFVAAEGGPKLLLDAGDWFQGTPEGTLSQGRVMAEVFNTLSYDAVALGNHEYDLGEETLKALIKEIKAPVLAANIYKRGEGRVEYAKPWIVKEVAGIKVGIFGLLTSHMRRVSFEKNVAGLEFRREVDEARDAVAALRKEGATVIIALTHVGLENPARAPFEGDQTLAAEVAGIDLIVGGHTHVPLRKAIRDATHGTLIVQAGHQLSTAGRVVLELDPATRAVVASTASLVDLWLETYGEDGKIKELTARAAEEAGKTLDLAIATATASLSHDRKATVESALGDWMTDCLREWAKTDVAFQNSGGIRAPMPAGPVSRRTIFNIMPFENRVVKLKVTGAVLEEILDHGVAGGFGMLQLSGAVVTYDKKLPRGKRVVSASVGGGPLKADAVYSAAAVDFMVSGGDGYSPFSKASAAEPTDTLMREVLEWCAERQGEISPPPRDRIKEG